MARDPVHGVAGMVLGKLYEAAIAPAPQKQEPPMPDAFARLIPDARTFLGELAENNHRDWFTAQKPRYESQLKIPATQLLDQIAQDVRKRTGQTLHPKLFRAHRDVRFSRDKTPCHIHLHMLWTIKTSTRQKPALFFGIAPDYVRAGAGIMGFDKSGLDDWRAAVDGPFGDAMQQVLDDLATKGFSPEAPELKRVPAPFAKDHRHGDLLRRKGLTLWRDLPGDTHNAPMATLNATFEALQPMLDRLQQVL